MIGELDTDSPLYDNQSKDMQIINNDSFKVRLSGIFPYYINHTGKTNQFPNRNLFMQSG